MPSYFKGVGSSWQALCLLVSPLTLGVSVGEEVQPACRAWREQGQRILHRCTKHWAAVVISRQVLANSGLGRFPQGSPRPLNGQQGCSLAGFHASFSQIVDTCHEDKHWAIVPKVCHPFLSFAQRTLEDEDGKGKVKERMASSWLRTSHHQR